MSSTEEVQRELDSLREALSAFEGDVPERYSPMWFTHQSLLTRQANLRAELELVGELPFEVVIDGKPVVDGSLTGKFAGRLLTNLQNALAAVAQSITGRTTRRGVIGREIADQAELRLAATAPGSFRLGFARPTRGPEQPSLMDAPDNRSLFDQAVDRLLDVLDATGRDRYEDTIHEVAADLSGRALGHLESLARTMTGADASARFVHRTGLDQAVRTVNVTLPAAQRLEQVLTSVREQQRTIRVTGRLIGASWATDTFDLEVRESGGEPRTFSGRVDPELRQVVDDNFDQVVTAVLSVRTVRSEVAGEESEQFELIDVD